MAVQLLKHELSHAPVLVYPDFTKPFYIETDGSKVGLGAVLSQKDDNGRLHPILFDSRTLLERESRCHATDLEGLALIWALNQFHPYIYGHKVIILTDHSALKALLKKENLSDRLYRWAVSVGCIVGMTIWN